MRLRKTKVIFSSLLIFIVLFSSHAVDAKKRGKKRRVTCRSVILSDSTTSKRLYGKSVERQVLPASTTKVMTALLVLERLSLQEYVEVGPQAVHVQATKLGLVPGEQYKVSDLLYAILLKSANDASVVLAEAVAGSEENFVKMMNERAKALGAHHTKFANSHGLPSRKRAQYTTAYDMYLIFRQALKNSFFRSVIQERYKTIYSKEGRKIAFKSHNKILFSDWKKKIYGKTGYTKAAGACFVGTLNKNGKTLIVGVFGCTNRWEDIKYVVSRYGGVPL